jgi:hypothetical protein
MGLAESTPSDPTPSARCDGPPHECDAPPLTWAEIEAADADAGLEAYVDSEDDEGHQLVDEGGFGSVFLVTDAATGEARALKRYRGRDAEAAAGWVAERAVYEAVAAAGRPAPWLPRFHGARAEDLSLELELLGEDLFRVAASGTLTAVPGLRGALARGALDALEALHGAGFIHRDVKLENFATRRAAAAAPAVVLLDFGGALPWERDAAGRLRVPRSRGFVGTPDYASLRQLAGARLGLSDDLESLGYALLALYRADHAPPWHVDASVPRRRHGRGRGADSADGGAPLTGRAWTRWLRRCGRYRARVWAALVAEGEIPAWLCEWVEYCRALDRRAAPDYARLRELLADAPEPAEAAPPASVAERSAKRGRWAPSKEAPLAEA